MKLPKVPQRTTPGFAFSMVDRALQECLATRQFRQVEIEQVLEFFGSNPPECVFCGSKDVRRWDHLIPIKSGGETVLGNMVPTCAQCDDSKRDLYFEDWITSDAPKSPKSRGVKDIDQRIEHIKAYMQHYGYSPRNLEDRLNEDEKNRLKLVRSKLIEVREDIETLVNDYRARAT